MTQRAGHIRSILKYRLCTATNGKSYIQLRVKLYDIMTDRNIRRQHGKLLVGSSAKK